VAEKNTSKPKKTIKKGTISGHMYAVAILPVVLFAILITCTGIPFLTRLEHKMAEKELKDICKSTIMLMDARYPGDYELKGEDSLFLYKGDTDITTDPSVIDSVKEATGLDITIFYEDTRILTTITDTNGTRMVGTGIASRIYDTVYGEGLDVFYTNTEIFGTPYYTYYMPITSSSGDIRGMIATARPSEDIDSIVKDYIILLILVSLVLTGLMIAIVIKITKPMTKSVESIFRFVRETSNGNDSAVIDESVLRRNDELSDIAESVLSLQRSMRNLMESDPLTGLFNRRSAHRKIGPIIAKSKNSGEPFCIAIGDIDFFKSVNDTYGHDAGDEVLVKVADILREYMRNCGFVARWGGEEFLLVFDRTGLLMAENQLWSLLESIRALEIRYDNYIIKLTMSFGVSEWDGKESVDALVKDADDKLYYAKNNGRNRVVSEIEGRTGSGDSEIDKLLDTIRNAEENSEDRPEEGHFKNLSKEELEYILTGKADEDASGLGEAVSADPITFSDDSYT